jgi:hypothetical protein
VQSVAMRDTEHSSRQVAGYRVCLDAAAAYRLGVADPDREKLVSLCEQVLSGDMTIDDLDQAWPAPVGNPSLARLREALEDGIEHAPVDPQGGVNVERWQTMPEYDDIEFYLQTLREAVD